MMPEDKVMKQIQQYTFKHLRSNGVSPVFLLREFDLHCRLQMFEMREIRSFSYGAGSKIMKKSAIHNQTFALEQRKYRFLLRDLDLHFGCNKFKMCISLKR